MLDETADLVTLDGTVKKVMFHNPVTGWTVLRLSVPNRELEQTVVGKLQPLAPGEVVRLTGRHTTDPKHGAQFEAYTCLPLTPSTIKGIEAFLGSGLIPGIGEGFARRIVDAFGLESLEVLEHAPQRLAEVPGIGPKRAQAISAALVEKKAERDVLVFLEATGVSAAYAARIVRRYGTQSIRLVQENPYRLASDVAGIGFIKADQIARGLGFNKNSPERAEAGLAYTLQLFAEEGHVYAPRQALLQRATQLLELDLDALERALCRLMLQGGARLDSTGEEERLYLPKLHRAETSAAADLFHLLEAKPRPIEAAPAALVELAEQRCGVELSAEQRAAVAALAQAKVMLLSGGPGTGKTTVLRGIVAALEANQLTVEMAAPTGRAARRMEEATGKPARTLHRMLEYAPRNGRFERNRNSPLLADVVIVDETSMVDIELFAALVEALAPSARLILVGDPDQLPSVGPGAVLHELLSLGEHFHLRLKAMRLERIFRQGQQSLIVGAAHDILRGQEPQAGEKGQNADLFIIEREDPQAIIDVIKELVGTRIPRSFGLNPVEDIQVLTPMHKGSVGASRLNAELKALLNRGKDDSDAAPRLGLGDKVMQIRNNYDLDVFNGDIGRVTREDEELGALEVTFPDRKVSYPSSELDQLVLAYACSVHKSQGSEYPAVVIALHTQHYVLLQRNLLYTAVTRGKRLVVIVGSRQALRIAVKNRSETRRMTALAQRCRTLALE
ncbi:MAG: ATP-dependent RecD-like DNA helicase [Myxococcota bacterium]|jgi:exodeoxyribonuclease V alpha subunit|nr:ATP-dependent RecD-like DNA helicase [Myxococcota bacterium]